MQKVFISYSHRDREFVEHLDSQLKVLVDVFWDWNLRAGNWINQLTDEIEACDYFVVVMSQEYEQREMCQWELNKAFEYQKQDRHMIPIYRGHPDERLNELQYGDFTGDFDFSRNFDEGFRKLTWFTLGERISPWETFFRERDFGVIRDNIKKGFVPSLILREWGDWICIDQLWGYFQNEYLSNDEFAPRVFTPPTPYGVLDTFQMLLHEFVKSQRGQPAIYYMLQVSKMINEYLTVDSSISIDARAEVANNVLNLIQQSERFLGRQGDIKNAHKYAYYQPYVMDKLRGLIAYHSRRLK